MATVTHQVTTADTGNTPNTTGAFTPGAGDLLVVVIVATATVTEADGSLTSSDGLTFTLAVAASKAASADRVYIYVANAPANAVSQTVTFGPADTATGTVITVYSVAGMTKVGAAAIKQIAEENDQAGGGTPTATFSANVDTNNPTIGGVGNATNPATLTEPTGWTEPVGADAGYATPTTGLESVFRDSGFSGTTITWGSTSGSAFGTVAIELDASAVTEALQDVIGAGVIPFAR